jgi:hypothetical protein
MRPTRTTVLALLALAPPVAAQSALPSYVPPPSGRVIETHSISDPQGSLMGFYSALLIFAPDGAPSPAKAWTVDLTANFGYVPPLNYDQRTAGRDKPEATNLTSIFGYPKVTLWFPAHIGFTAAYTPPVDIGGAKPYIYAFALEGLAVSTKSLAIVPRLTYTGGYITAPITCNENLSTSGNSSFEFYWATVCNARESTDRLEPNQWTFEVNASGSWMQGKLLPFAGLGVVQYKTTFDIQVQTGSGIDTDHPILKMNATEGYGMLGATWVASPLWRFGGSLFWEPNMVFTGRLSATLRLNGI